jgi:hypothetical protein
LHTDLWLRNANAEFAALCLAPLALGAAVKLSRPTALGLGLAAVILTHNLTALALAGLLLFCGACTLVLQRGMRGAGRFSAGLGLGLGLSAFFWIPAVALADRVRTAELTTGRFAVRDHFPALGRIFGYGALYGIGVVPPLVLLASAVALVVAWRRGSDRARPLGVALAAAALLGILLTRATVPVWESLPLLPLFQYPWRLLGPLAILTALAGALAAAELTAGRSARLRGLVELAVFAACLLNVVPRMLDHRPMEEPLRSRLAAALTPEGVRQGLYATAGDEYLPRSAQPAVWQERRPRAGPLVATSEPAAVEVLHDAGTTSILAVQSDRPLQLELARWAFPGWRITVDGDERPAAANPLGSLDADVPAGSSRVELVYRQPAVRRVGLAVSGAVLVAWAAWLATSRTGARSSSRARSRGGS